jgi:hypothetical protein
MAKPRKPREPKVCIELDLAFPVRLLQFGRDDFTVVYGLQIKSGLNYTDAAYEFGCCVMHALACDGKLDNR